MPRLPNQRSGNRAVGGPPFALTRRVAAGLRSASRIEQNQQRTGAATCIGRARESAHVGAHHRLGEPLRRSALQHRPALRATSPSGDDQHDGVTAIAARPHEAVKRSTRELGVHAMQVERRTRMLPREPRQDEVVGVVAAAFDALAVDVHAEEVLTIGLSMRDDAGRLDGWSDARRCRRRARDPVARGDLREAAGPLVRIVVGW